MSEFVVCGVPFESKSREELLERCRELKQLGVTAVQIYTYWNKIEPDAEGTFDWSYYDSQVSVLQEAGLKWVPFFLMGPRYAAPEWWLSDARHVGMVCLEHHKETPCESIWSPVFLKQVDRVMKAFCEHYLPMNVIESFQPGISGDYGETEFPDIGNWPGCYHSHRGFWCGGADAKASYEAFLQAKFGTVEALNKAWRSAYASFAAVPTFLPHEAPSRTAWYDFLEWYRGSMTAYTEKWLEICRRNLPDTPIYMCIGGMEQPELGTQFADQIAALGKYHCGIRLTNEGNKFYDNYHWTALAKAACDHYGAYMGLEPVGPITPLGVTTRIFGSAAYANRQMFHYYTNLMGTDGKPAEGGENFRKYIGLVKEGKQAPGIAMFWPAAFASFFASNPDNLNDNTSSGIPAAVSGALGFLRRQVNTAPLNERLILDGALEHYKVLVSPLGVFTHGAALRKIAQWVKNGGVLVTAGVPKNIEMQDEPEFVEACGLQPDYELAIGHNEQYLEPDCPYEGFRAFPQFHSTAGVMGLLPETRVLSASRVSRWGATVTQKVFSATEHDYGKGKVLLWLGRVTFADDPNAIFPDPGVFRALLTDVIKKYAGVPMLVPGEDEIARAIIDGKTMALTNEYEIKEV